MFIQRLLRAQLVLVLLMAILATATLTAKKIKQNGEIIIHNDTTYGTVTSHYTGKVWLDRNLGASQACTSFNDTECYGDYYQWGRNFDGHQKSTSATTSIQATDVNNPKSHFVIKGKVDWASVDTAGAKRSENWSKTDGSSVCPVGYRVPTLLELKAETLDNGVSNRDSAFTNFLKLPSAGSRYSCIGSLNAQGSLGYVWTNTVSGSHSYSIDFSSDNAKVFNGYSRGNGFSVRCLRE